MGRRQTVESRNSEGSSPFGGTRNNWVAKSLSVSYLILRCNMNKVLAVGLVVFAGCVDRLQPFPEVGTTGTPPHDSGTVVVDGQTIRPDVVGTDVTTLTPTDNGYVCYCRFEVPLNCVYGGWCGIPGTNTSTTHAGYCDVGVREAHVCLPDSLNPTHTGWLATPSEVEADCTGRVQDTLREALRMQFRNCRGEAPGLNPCDIQYGCTALRTDGTVVGFHDNRCQTTCPMVPLTVDVDGNLNYDHASYIPADHQVVCDGPNETTDLVCAWQ